MAEPGGPTERPPSERTPADASRAVLGRGSIYTLGTAAPILAQVAVTPAVTRILGPVEGWGQVAGALVVSQVVMMLVGLGIPSVITRQALLAGSGMPGARHLMRVGAGISLALGTVLIALEPWWGSVIQAGIGSTLRLAVAIGSLLAIVEAGLAILRAQDRPVAFVGLAATASLGGPVIGLAMLLGDRVLATPATYLFGVVAGYLVAVVVALVLTFGPSASRPGDLREALRLGLPVLPHVMALFLTTGALVLLAGRVFGEEHAGRMQIALLVGASAGVVISALNNSWAPTVYALAGHRRGAAVERTARDVALLAALLCGGVGLLSPWLLALFADDRFEVMALVPAVCVIGVGSMLSVAYLANVHLVFAAGRNAGLAVVTPISLLLGVGSAVALTPRSPVAPDGVGVDALGLVSVAVGFPITYAALACGVAVLRRRVGAPQWREGRLVGPFLVGAAALGLGAVLPTSGLPSLTRWVIAAGLGVGVVGLARRIVGRDRPDSPE